MRAKRVGVMAAVVGYGRSAMAVSVPGGAWVSAVRHAYGGAVQPPGRISVFPDAGHD